MDSTSRGTADLGARLLGGLRLVTAVALAIALSGQIIDLALHDALTPTHYFAYFTIDSTLIEIAVLAIAGIGGLAGRASGRMLTTATIAIVPYALVTGAVYNVMLRGLPPEPGQYLSPDWMNEVMHVAGPIVIGLDGILLAPLLARRARLGWAALAAIASFPLIWLAITFVRGAADGWLPYPFLMPGGPGGVGSVVLWCTGLAAGIVGLGAVLVATTRRRGRHAVSVGSASAMR